MRRYRVLGALVVVLLVVTLSGCTKLGLGGAIETASGDRPDDVTAVEPKARELLQRMSAVLKEAKALRFHVESTYDEVGGREQKIQFASSADVAVRRPDRLFAVRRGDAINSRLYYDGKTLSLLEPTLNVYVQFPAPQTIDAAMDHAAEQFGITAPATDLVFSDPGATLLANVVTGEYVGEHYVGPTKCHHLAFTQEAIDWQIWIDAGAKPLPLKLVITYRTEPLAPQFTSVFSQWEFPSTIADKTFQFVPPAKAKRIPALMKTPQSEAPADERRKP